MKPRVPQISSFQPFSPTKKVINNCEVLDWKRPAVLLVWVVLGQMFCQCVWVLHIQDLQEDTRVKEGAKGLCRGKQVTLPKTNSSHLKIGLNAPKVRNRSYSNHPFSGAMLDFWWFYAAICLMFFWWLIHPPWFRGSWIGMNYSVRAVLFQLQLWLGLICYELQQLDYPVILGERWTEPGMMYFRTKPKDFQNHRVRSWEGRENCGQLWDFQLPV